MASCSWVSLVVPPSRGDRVALDLVDQRRAGDAELGGGAGAVAAVVPERALDVLPLELVEGKRRVPPVADAGPRAELTREVLHAELRPAAAEDERALEHVPHLPHVSRPGIAEQPLERLARELRRAFRQLVSQVAEETGDEREAVVAR